MTVRIGYSAASTPVVKVTPREAQLLNALADKMQPALRRAFLEAVDRIGSGIDWKAVQAFVERGQLEEAVSLINRALDAGGYDQVAAAIRSSMTLAGVQLAGDVVRFLPGVLDVRFDVTNPETARFLREYGMGTIRQLNADTLAQVRLALTNGINAGRNPLDTARDVRAFLGLTDRQTQAVMNFRRALEQGDRAALQRALRDRRFDPSLRRMAEKPLTAEQVDRMTERYRQRYLKYRAETIARTESIRAVQAGQQQLWRQMVSDGVIGADEVRRKWYHVNDGRVRHAHRTIPILNPDGVGLEEPFKSEQGPIMFPGDPAAPVSMVANCRCTVILRYVPRAGSNIAA